MSFSHITDQSQTNQTQRMNVQYKYMEQNNLLILLESFFYGYNFYLLLLVCCCTFFYFKVLQRIPWYYYHVSVEKHGNTMVLFFINTIKLFDYHIVHHSTVT